MCLALQEKEILEKHIEWLRGDATSKAAALLEERRAREEAEEQLRLSLQQVISCATCKCGLLVQARD